jgi:hypothetical protein
MAGPKETYEISLNTDQMVLIQSIKNQFEIASDSKVLRIVMDYLIQNPDVHESVFTETRCLRCE